MRAYLDGRAVADNRPAMGQVWESPAHPTYYIPSPGDVLAALVATGDTERLARAGVRPRSSTRSPMVVRSPGGPGGATDSPLDDLRDAVRLDWAAMDEWLEEDEPVYTASPRSVQAGVDILAGSRHVRVKVDGVCLADSHSPRLLFETSLPVRYYLPLGHVRTDLMRPTNTTDPLPVQGGRDVLVGAGRPALVPGSGLDVPPAPLPESQKIAGLACFYHEKVDLYVDGVLQERPHTVWS